jgi:hypothetical protein
MPDHNDGNARLAVPIGPSLNVADCHLTGCWASSGQAAAGCIALEQQLRTCMDLRVRIQLSMQLRCRLAANEMAIRMRNQLRRVLSTTTSRASTRESWAQRKGNEPIQPNCEGILFYRIPKSVTLHCIAWKETRRLGKTIGKLLLYEKPRYCRKRITARWKELYQHQHSREHCAPRDI